ncbi:DUF2637 domain-containing protein [Streptomyces sp. NPDC056891]|uniref:DUF2637 domain-containing protein n=1 Tax=Streptomyces sp. NPDC056891 TaxID=3345961 RepID=UPI0036A72695
MDSEGEKNPPSKISDKAFRVLTGTTVVGGLIVGSIGFVGSYGSLKELGVQKGFGDFSYAFPIGVDAGIIVLLGFDLILTRKHIPFPLLRHVAWMLTAATIWFNAHAGVPDPTPQRPAPKLMDDPLSAAMHALLPVLFITLIEAARHAIRRLANLAAGREVDSIRLSRWLLDAPRTFLLWRRMRLWELRSYEKTVGMERDRMVYRRKLRARYGRAWRRKAPIELSLPLALVRYGEQLPEAPLTEEEERQEQKKHEAREARVRQKREAKQLRKDQARKVREEKAREEREAREAEREARKKDEREAHEREMARLAALREEKREAHEAELAKIKAEGDARTSEARIKAEAEERRAIREAERLARERAEAQLKALEDEKRRTDEEAAKRAEAERLRSEREAREPETPRLAIHPARQAPRTSRVSQSVAPTTRAERRAQKDEAEREAAKIIVGGSQMPTAIDFGKQYGQGETWGGDRIRAARTRLAQDPAFKDEVETELLEAAYAADASHAP